MSDKEKYKKIIEAIRQKAGHILPKGSRIALFGSRARGDARSDSDWDLHVLIPGDERLSLEKTDEICWAFSAIGIYQFDEEIETMVYTKGDWAKRNFLPFYKNVENDKIIIFQN